MQFISNVEVCYGDEPSKAPTTRVIEMSHQSDDINYEFGGSYVWLVPHYTFDRDAALTSIDVVVQGSADSTQHDLAKGAGGDYRYLVFTKNAAHSDEPKVTEVILLRLADPMGGLPAGWNGTTIDINKGRGKTYLYLIWKTA